MFLFITTCVPVRSVSRSKQYSSKVVYVRITLHVCSFISLRIRVFSVSYFQELSIFFSDLRKKERASRRFKEMMRRAVRKIAFLTGTDLVWFMSVIYGDFPDEDLSRQKSVGDRVVSIKLRHNLFWLFLRPTFPTWLSLRSFVWLFSFESFPWH